MVSRFLRSAAVRIDVKNRKLLGLLCEDGRATATQLGHKLRLSREVVSYRLNRLQQMQVLQGFTVNVRYKRLGVRLFQLFFLVNERSQSAYQEFIQALVAHPRTVSVIELSDTWDVGWLFVCENLDEFDGVVTRTLGDFSELIIEFERFITITTYVWHMFPATVRPRQPHTSTKERLIDDTDASLLLALAEAGRASSYELAARVRVSSDTVIARMRALEKKEILDGCTAIVNVGSLGLSWYIFALQCRRLTLTDEQRLAEFVGAHPYILRAVKLFGRWSIMLDIVVENAEQYHQTVKEVKSVFGNILRRYESWSVYEERHYNAFPPALLDDGGHVKRNSNGTGVSRARR
jgi:Lrp/AsnC family leucine-responsive transcriptional regulator